MSALSSWLNSHKSIIVHTLGMAGIVAANAANASGNKAAIAGIALATSAFHLSEGLANGGGVASATGAITEAASALQDLIGDATAAKGAAAPAGA